MTDERELNVPALFRKWRQQVEREYPGVTIYSEERNGQTVGAVAVLNQKIVSRWPQ